MRKLLRGAGHGVPPSAIEQTAFAGTGSDVNLPKPQRATQAQGAGPARPRAPAAGGFRANDRRRALVPLHCPVWPEPLPVVAAGFAGSLVAVLPPAEGDFEFGVVTI